MSSPHRLWRSWPWTIALATVLAGFVLLGLFSLAFRPSVGERLVYLAVTGAAVAGLSRALTMGVRTTPTGLAIRELTRTTLIPWTRVRGVTSRPTDRRRVHAPVLLLAPERAVKGGPRGRRADEQLVITVLGSYSAVVAQRRADELAKARPASRV